jgi:ferritin-like metal-binding protein YciE
MAKTKTVQELLIVALQDLNDGEHAVVERMASIARKVSPGLARYMTQERKRAASQSARLEKALEELDSAATGAPNIWLRAVLDDAARDSRTIEPGPLRDIALVGAFRKAKQSERVSYETAVGLAKVTARTDLAKNLLLCRDEEATADAALAKLLEELLALTSS